MADTAQQKYFSDRPWNGSESKMKAKLHWNIYDYSAVVSLEMPPNAIFSTYSPANEEFCIVGSLAAMYGQSARSLHLHDDFVRHVPLEFLERQAYAVLHSCLLAYHTFLA